MNVNTEVEDKDVDVYLRWRNDWLLFAEEALRVNLDDEQKEILKAVQHNRMVAVAAGTARGKDFVGAVAALCFFYLTPTFNDKGELVGNTKVALTAPNARQIDNIMYPEVTRLFNKAKGLYGRLVGTDIRTDFDEWFLTGFKADDTRQEVWSGFHAVNTMFVVTEASGISENTFAAIEGNLQGNSRLLIIFNPNTTIGYAARAMSSPRFKSFRLDDLNAPNVKHRKILIPGQVDYDWVIDKIQNWCEPIYREDMDETRGDFKWFDKDTGTSSYYRPNDLFRVKVRGMFPEVSEDILIPDQWIQLAQERWRMVKSMGLMKSLPKMYGVDVAGMGRDASAICERMGDFVLGFDVHQSKGKADHMNIANIVAGKLKGNRNVSFIDTIGEGAGVYSRLIELTYGARTYSVKNSESAQGLSDITGQYEFSNMRAYLAWAVRDWLNPVNETGACLPPDQRLNAECKEIRYLMPEKTGKVQIESKEDIKKRLGKSTDLFDSLAMTFYPKANNRRMKITSLSGYLP